MAVLIDLMDRLGSGRPGMRLLPVPRSMMRLYMPVKFSQPVL
jgi:hypothetical protein